MKKLLAILITVLSLAALVTPTYARVTIPAGSGYSKHVGESSVNHAVVIPAGTELYTDGDVNIRELNDVSSYNVHTVNAPYGNCRSFSFFVENENFYWGKGSDGLDHQWTAVCFTADMSSFYGFVRTDLLIVDYDVELTYVDVSVNMDNKYCDVGEGTISFRDLTVDTTLNDFLNNDTDEFVNYELQNTDKVYSMRNPRFGFVTITGNSNYECGYSTKDRTYFNCDYETIGTFVISYDPINIAGHDVDRTVLKFVGTEKDNMKFFDGIYFFPDEDCVNTYSDLRAKLTTLYGEPTEIVEAHDESLEAVYWIKENGCISLSGYTYGHLGLEYAFNENIDNLCHYIIDKCNTNELSTNVDGL